MLKLDKVVHHIILMHLKKNCGDRGSLSYFFGWEAKKNTIFFLIFAKPYHSETMHISVFFSDGMYSVLTILCNYLQMITQITLFMKKKYYKILM